MKKLLLLPLLLSSCYSSKVAEKQVIKAQTNYPEVVAKSCMLYYPTKDSIHTKIEYIKGKDSIIDNYITIDCDSVKVDTITKTRIVTKNCPPSSNRVDTFVKEVIKTIERTDKEVYYQTIIKEKDNEIDKINIYRKQWKFTSISLLVLLLVYLVFKFVKYKLK